MCIFTYFYKLCYFIGITFTLKVLFETFTIIHKLFIRKPKNLIERYGNESWVLVTGASDGIGKSFCEEFAKIGFNIILVARNLQKLQNVENQLKQINSSIQTKIMIYDFSSTTSHNSIDCIIDQVKLLDISILVNNVGVTTTYLYEDFTSVSEEDIQNVITVNCSAQLYLSRKIIPLLQARQNLHYKSAILNISSQINHYPGPYVAVYAATKIFNNYLSKALSYELSQNKHPQKKQINDIDCMVLNVGPVVTNMTQNLFKIQTQPPKFIIISADKCVKGCLRDMGYENESYGHWKHILCGILIKTLPNKLYYDQQLIIKKQIEEQIKNKKID